METKINISSPFYSLSKKSKLFVKPYCSSLASSLSKIKMLSDLKEFVKECKANPSLLAHPSLSFFTDYLQSFGCKLPQSAYRSGDNKSKFYEVDDSDEDNNDEDDMDEVEEVGEAKHKTVYEEEEEEEILESDVEFEGETVVPDYDPPQKMGDSSVEVSEENRDAAQEAKGKAMGAFSEGYLEEAIEHLTQAIMLNPASAMMYATRATVYIKMKKPNAAIRDANAAIEINPDSAKGHKSRGMARAMLGQWKEAAKDLHVASNIDYDEEISAVLKKVEPNVHKIKEHRRKYDRLHKEREDRKAERERQRRKAEAQAAYEKAKKQEKASSGRGSGGMPRGVPGSMPGGFPHGMPGGGGMPGAGGMPGGMPGTGGMPGGIDYSKIFKAILNDPEMLAAMKNPEIIAALHDVTKDSANFAKHEQNPRVGPMLTKMFNMYRS